MLDLDIITFSKAPRWFGYTREITNMVYVDEHACHLDFFGLRTTIVYTTLK